MKMVWLIILMGIFLASLITVKAYPVIPLQDLKYDLKTGVMSDTNGLKYSFDKDGVFLVNGRRVRFEIEYMGVKEPVSTESLPVLSDNKFDLSYSSSNAMITQELSFSPTRSAKILHKVTATQVLLPYDTTLYYVFQINAGDTIEINHSVCSYDGKCNYKDYVDRPYVINFNAEYDFNYQDVIDSGYKVQSIEFNHNELWLGFNIGKLNMMEEKIIDPNFASAAIETIAIAPLDNKTYVVVWCDETGDDITMAIYNTTGSVILSAQDVDDAAGACTYDGSHVAVTALNSTHFIVAYDAATAADCTFAYYNKAGTQIALLDVETAACRGVDVTALNSTDFIFAWINQVSVNYYAYSNHYRIPSTKIGNTITVDAATIGGSGISVSALNNQNWVTAYYDTSSSDVWGKVYNIDESTSVTVNPTSNICYTEPSVSAINSSTFTIQWVEISGYLHMYATYNIAGTLTSGIVTLYDDTGVIKQDDLTAIKGNTNIVAFSFFDRAALDQSVSVFYTKNDAAGSIWDSDASGSSSYMYNAIGSYEAATGIGLCNQGLVHAYLNSAGTGVLVTYYANGTAWNGVCRAEASPPADTCTYSGSGNWHIKCSDNCHLTTATTLIGFLNISNSGGTGMVYVQNTINATRLYIMPTCKLNESGTTKRVVLH